MMDRLGDEGAGLGMLLKKEMEKLFIEDLDSQERVWLDLMVILGK